MILELPELTEKDIRRFWFYTHKLREDDCWHFGAQLNRAYFVVNGVNYVAARIAWKIKTGDDPGNFLVCHTCDNRLCVNPSHLFLGTCADNTQDMVQKCRSVKGEKHGRARLTEVNVKEIKLLLSIGHTPAEIAPLYGICSRLIAHIKTGDRWAHV